MGKRCPTLLLAVFLAGGLWAQPAAADAPSESAATLFVRARALMKTGDCANALPLLEQSHALEPTLGARFNMAICESKFGKLLEAMEHLRSVVAASAANDERRAYAERTLRELSARIPHVVLELDESRHELRLVRLDGVPLQEVRANEPIAINPGLHELEVVIAREAPRVRRFSLAEQQVYTWSLGSSSDPQADSQGAPNPDANAPKDNGPPSMGSQPSTIWSPQRTVAAGLAGTSVAAFGVATGFAVSARSMYDSSDPYCGSDDVCEPGGIERRDRARQHGSIATVALTVCVASALTAGTLWLTGAPQSPRPSKAVRAGVRFIGSRGPGGGIVVEGSY